MWEPYTTELRASGLYTSTPYFRLPIHYKEFKKSFLQGIHLQAWDATGRVHKSQFRKTTKAMDSYPRIDTLRDQPFYTHDREIPSTMEKIPSMHTQQNTWI